MGELDFHPDELVKAYIEVDTLMFTSRVSKTGQLVMYENVTMSDIYQVRDALFAASRLTQEAVRRKESKVSVRFRDVNASIANKEVSYKDFIFEAVNKLINKGRFSYIRSVRRSTKQRLSYCAEDVWFSIHIDPDKA